MPDVSHAHGQQWEPLLLLPSAPGGATKVPRDENWQLLSVRGSTIATAAETARPGLLSCTVQTARAELCPYSKEN